MREKKFKFYAVVDNIDEEAPIENRRVYTITHKLNDAFYYIDIAYRFKYESHFQSWCSCRDLEPNEKAWSEYKSIVLEDRNEFAVYELLYTLPQIATIFRMFNNCTPLGCDYETDYEQQYFIDKIPDDKAT